MDDESVLVIDESDRYARLRLISWWRQDRLAQAHVLIVGVGALGNEVIKNLALMGVGHLYIIDFDDVEPSNLSRSVMFRMDDGGRPKAEVAADWIRRANPDVEVTPIVGDVILDVGLGLFRHVDVVIGCLDNREARLWVNRQCWKVGTPWIDGGIQEIQGVVKVFRPPHSACYECGMTAQDYRLLNLRYSCPLLSRDEILSGKVPTAPTIASMIAALQVQEALKLLHEIEVQDGVIHVFNGVGNTFYTTQLPRRDDCLSHESYPDPVPLPIGSNSTAGELFSAVSPMIEGQLILPLDRELVTRILWPSSGTERIVMRPRSRVSESWLTSETGESGRPELISHVEQGGRFDSSRLADLGIPSWDILVVEGADQAVVVELAADRPDAEVDAIGATGR